MLRLATFAFIATSSMSIKNMSTLCSLTQEKIWQEQILLFSLMKTHQFPWMNMIAIRDIEYAHFPIDLQLYLPQYTF